MTPAMRSNLRALMRANKVPRLENMSQSWSRLSAQHASAAYAASFEAVDLMMEMYANFGIANVLRNPAMLPQVTAALDKRLFEELALAQTAIDSNYLTGDELGCS